MKKIIIALLVLVSLTFGGDKTIFDVCNRYVCYEQIVDNMKSWEWKTDLMGNKFVRVYFYDKSIMDITGTDLTVKPRKKR
jgi:hypothetical protein